MEKQMHFSQLLKRVFLTFFQLVQSNEYFNFHVQGDRLTLFVLAYFSTTFYWQVGGRALDAPR